MISSWQSPVDTSPVRVFLLNSSMATGTLPIFRLQWVRQLVSLMFFLVLHGICDGFEKPALTKSSGLKKSWRPHDFRVQPLSLHSFATGATSLLCTRTGHVASIYRFLHPGITDFRHLSPYHPSGTFSQQHPYFNVSSFR